VLFQGTLVDSITRQPIEFASVGVLEFTTGKVINGSLSDDRGIFRISDIPW
jgi:hypothetical protein